MALKRLNIVYFLYNLLLLVLYRTIWYTKVWYGLTPKTKQEKRCTGCLAISPNKLDPWTKSFFFVAVICFAIIIFNLFIIYAQCLSEFYMTNV